MEHPLPIASILLTRFMASALQISCGNLLVLSYGSARSALEKHCCCPWIIISKDDGLVFALW